MCPLFRGMGNLDILFNVLFWSLLICVFLSLLSKKPSGGTSDVPAGPGKDSALDILKRRYASGEIKRDEFLAAKKDLE